MDKLSRSILAMSLDPMCVPQIDDPFRLADETFAQSLAVYINFVHDDELTNPLDVTVIY
jgi:hypothetical protein